MFCYQCGCSLTENDFCTKCGADVGLYKKIVASSNVYYNEGLDRAKVRDLSGAIVCLRQSIKLNKNHIDARNLLGLIYFEMGETMTALNEWIISLNIRPKKNVAEDYVNALQSNRGRVEELDKDCTKKYNRALDYCRQDSLDLARIQLKQALGINPKYVQAHLLLALIYISAEAWDKAQSELEKVRKIDTNNNMMLRYMKLVSAHTHIDEEQSLLKKRKNRKAEEPEEERVAPNVFRDPPASSYEMRETNALSILLYVLAGLVVGIAVAWFLILPARMNRVKDSTKDEVNNYAELLAGKNDEVKKLSEANTELTKRISEMESSLNGYSGTQEMVEAYEKLTYAAYLYLYSEADAMAVADALEAIDDSDYYNGSENYRSVKDLLQSIIRDDAAVLYYGKAMDYYNLKEYDQAITYLLLAVKYSPENESPLLYLGNAYRLNGNEEEAIETYNTFIEKFPKSQEVKKVKKYLSDYES